MGSVVQRPLLLPVGARRLRHVWPDFVGVSAADRSNELAFALVNLDPQKNANMMLLRHRRSPPDDVDLAHCDLGVALSQFVNRRVHHLARSAPIGITQLYRICTTNDRAGKNKIADGAPCISAALHATTVPLPKACATGAPPIQASAV